MLKYICSTAAFALAGFAAAPLAAQDLPGVHLEETAIPSGQLITFARGKGDVVFVQHRTLRWYRVQLNEGCLANGFVGNRIAFDADNATGRIDRFTRVILPQRGQTCVIDSIRRSATPPQYDNDSVVTLD